MATELKVPVLPESVTDATVADWNKKAGEAVSRDENLVDLETDKVMLEVPAPCDGVLKEIKHESGDTVESEQVLALIDEGAEASAPASDGGESASAPAPAAAEKQEAPAPAPEPAAAAAPAPAAADANLTPAARRYVEEENLDASQIEGTGRGGQITKEDAVNFAKSDSGGSAPAPAPKSAPAPAPSSAPAPAQSGARPEERVPMTRIRSRIAERLKQSLDSIAMLTSFNEVNLSEVRKIRKTHGEEFKSEHGVKLGYMSFFVKAVCEALKRHPVVNASIDGSDIVYHGYQDISIAVSTDKGLVTPVLRDAQDMSFAEIESTIKDYATRARDGKLGLDELQGGTFTVTNGGTFGSLLSTPIVNPPQSAILGMHTIKERPAVVDGEVVPAPMMYIAISYDHRLIDGKDAVLFLVDIKEQLENPQKMLLGM